MMLKSKQCKGRKLRALALVPAAAGALLVTNIPAVATCLATVSQSSLSTPQTVREVNEKVETKTQAVKESSMPTTVDAVETETKTDNNARTQNVNSKNAPQTDMGEKHLKNIGNDTMSLKTAETLPSFVGGDKAMFEWLIQNIEYPDVNLADQPETIRVIVKFIVDKNGNAIDPEIVRGGPEAYNQAAINVVNKMPTWEPGRIDGEPANVTFTLPINFKTKKDTPKAE